MTGRVSDNAVILELGGDSMSALPVMVVKEKESLSSSKVDSTKSGISRD